MATQRTLHVVMFPWLAMGHITPFLKLSNKLAEKGHRVSFLIPPNTQHKINHLNLHPHLIHFIPITIPHVDGLPLGVENTTQVPADDIHIPLLLQALDLTRDQVDIALHNLKPPPHFIFFDLAHWVPKLAQSHGIISIYYSTTAVLSCVYLVPKLLSIKQPDQNWAKLDVPQPPEPYPGSSSSEMPFHYQMEDIEFGFTEFNGEISLVHRHVTSMSEAKALCFASCSELEGPLVAYLEKQYNKQVLLIGPSITNPSSHTPLEQKWDEWLGGFDKGSVVYCAFGSECVLEKNQFQELVLGLEQTGFPFLVRLKPPHGSETVEEALPQGFEERVKGRGVVHGGWLQQQQILSHPSVGCFVSHAGFGSMSESMCSTCQLVLVPNVCDQFGNAKFMAKGLEVAIEVERREKDGWFTKESVCKAVKLVMDEGTGGIAQRLRTNHLKWRDLLLSEGFEKSYFDNFIINLHHMLN